MTRNKWGIVASLVYVEVVMLIVFLKRESIAALELNAIGDFLAGAFGPLAFLWLVLGYLQQGDQLKQNSDALEMQAKELRQNNKALLMQAEELKNSVEQQRELVLATREQIQLEENWKKKRAEMERESVSPELKLESITIPSQSGGLVEIRISNVGHAIKEVYVYAVDPEGNRDLWNKAAKCSQDKYIEIKKDLSSFFGRFWVLQLSFIYLNGDSGLFVYEMVAVMDADQYPQFSFNMKEKL